MGKSPDIVSVGEIMANAHRVASRWGNGATELANLVDSDGQETGYKVGGPAMAKFFTALATYCGVLEGVWVHQDLKTCRLTDEQALSKHGLMIIGWNITEPWTSAYLVVIHGGENGWLEYLDEAFDRFG